LRLSSEFRANDGRWDVAQAALIFPAWRSFAAWAGQCISALSAIICPAIVHRTWAEGFKRSLNIPLAASCSPVRRPTI
jgi:hypothetical protein